MKKCSNCTELIEDNAAFCHYCGSKQIIPPVVMAAPDQPSLRGPLDNGRLLEAQLGARIAATDVELRHTAENMRKTVDDLDKEDGYLKQRIIALEDRLDAISRQWIVSTNFFKKSVSIFAHQWLLGVVLAAVYVVIIIGLGMIGLSLGGRAPLPQVVPTFTLAATLAPTAIPLTTRTPVPTRRPTVRPFPSTTPRPTIIRPTARPLASTQRPTAIPSGTAQLTIDNQSGMSNRFVFWGPADKTIDVAANQSITVDLPAGSYGWTSFLPNGCKLNAADNLQVSGHLTVRVLSDSNPCGARLEWGP